MEKNSLQGFLFEFYVEVKSVDALAFSVDRKMCAETVSQTQ